MATTTLAAADQPPAAPKSFDIHSPAGKFAAHFSWPERQATVSSVAGNHHKTQLWSISAWSPVAFLSDHGPVLAIGNPDNNLLPMGSTGATIVATFYRDGAITRTIRVDEVIAPNLMLPTVSHLSWGVHLGFDTAGHYRIETVDGRIVKFDV